MFTALSPGASVLPSKGLDVCPVGLHASRGKIDTRYALDDLRAAVELFADAQRRRIATGERIRAVVQGRAPRWGSLGEATDPEVILDSIRTRQCLDSSLFLQRAYSRYVEEEKELVRYVSAAVIEHPAWIWLKDVRGAGPVLSARLLARLDIMRANTPSSFWSYCGLSTVPASTFSCSECGLTVVRPSGQCSDIRHKESRNRNQCVGTLAEGEGEGEGTRIAQPRSRSGQSRPYDAEAKRICYLIGISFIRQGGKFKQYYRAEREKLDETRPEWAKGRKHLTAMRKTEKRFLALLWTV